MKITVRWAATVMDAAMASHMKTISSSIISLKIDQVV